MMTGRWYSLLAATILTLLSSSVKAQEVGKKSFTWKCEKPDGSPGVCGVRDFLLSICTCCLFREYLCSLHPNCINEICTKRSCFSSPSSLFSSLLHKLFHHPRPPGFCHHSFTGCPIMPRTTKVRTPDQTDRREVCGAGTTTGDC